MRRLADSSRRGEEKKKKGKEEGRRRGERKKRNAEAGSALILKSTLGGLSPRFFSFPFFVSLSFSLFQSCETGALQRDEKSSRPPVVVSWGWKTHFLRPFFSFLPPSPPPFGFFLLDESSSFFSPSPLPLLSFRRRWNHSENDSTRFRGTFVWRAFNARALHRGTPNVLMLPQKKLYGGEKPCIWFSVIVPGEIIPIRIKTHDPRKLFADWNP